jgi:ribosomal-protein-alanine N-acetyltransferase
MMLPIYIRPYVLDDSAVMLEMNLRNREHFE